jgi:Tc toxin complex TcA C-terminal TcB-binding domain/Salmonella virulence plasmid 65kDa B protein
MGDQPRTSELPANGGSGSANRSVLATLGLNHPPTVDLPKGGGVITGIGEKIVANPAIGNGSMSVPIAATPDRGCCVGPQLASVCDSGSGNGLLGFGWSLGLPAITRIIGTGQPQYDHAGESDVFVPLGGGGPKSEHQGDRVVRGQCPGMAVRSGRAGQLHAPAAHAVRDHLGRHRSLHAGHLHAIAAAELEAALTRPGSGYPRTGTEDGRFVDADGTIQSIVTSSTNNDSGLHTVDLRDSRFLPGAGALSSWRLEPSPLAHVDYDCIADVLLHLRYTACDGSAQLLRKATEAVTDVVETAGAAWPDCSGCSTSSTASGTRSRTAPTTCGSRCARTTSYTSSNGGIFASAATDPVFLIVENSIT